MLSVFLTVLGFALIGAALLDVFQTLFHPAGRGAMSDWTAQVIWKCFRRAAARYRKLLTYAGPTAILAIITTWAALTWFGFALIYFPRLHSSFAFTPGVEGTRFAGLLEALDLSLGGLITLSEGINASSPWLQLLRGAEAVIGFGLLTASVSWLLSIYPVLESRRSIAERAALLHNAELENHLDITHDAPQEAQDWIFNIGCDLASLRNQMAQFPITYYFHVGEAQTSLAGALPYLAELADRASSSSGVSALLAAGTVLGGAVHNFLNTLAEVFLAMPGEDDRAVLRAYAREEMTDLMLRDRTIPFPRHADAS